MLVRRVALDTPTNWSTSRPLAQEPAAGTTTVPVAVVATSGTRGVSMVTSKMLGTFRSDAPLWYTSLLDPDLIARWTGIYRAHEHKEALWH